MVLVIALIMMVVMSMGAIALFRQMGAGIIIAGNLSFKQGATIASDRGVEEGRAWLKLQNEGTLAAAATGYFPAWCYTASSATADCSTSTTDFDPFTFNWASSSVKAVDDDGAGNTVRWVIHRLCRQNGQANSANCITTPPTPECLDPSSPVASCPMKSFVFYRVTTQVSGPRNTVSYTQAIIY